MKPKNSFMVSFASIIAGAILVASGLLLAGLLTAVKYESDQTALDLAGTLFGEIATKTTARIQGFAQSVATLTDTAALVFHGAQDLGTDAGNDPFLEPLTAMLAANNTLMSAYLGFEDGSFRQVIATRGDAFILKKYEAPGQTAYIDRSIRNEDGARRQFWRFLDATLRPLAERADPTTEYDPRNRPWYLEARQSQAAVFTEPYVFSSSRLPGLTCARALPDGRGAFGVDVTLARLGDMLAEQKVTENGLLWIMTRNGRLAAFPGMRWEEVVGEDLQLPEAAQAASPLARAVARQGDAPESRPLNAPFFLQAQGEPCMGYLASSASGNGLDLVIAVAAPLSDVTGPIGRMLAHVLLLAGCILAVVVPLAALLGRWAARPVTQLVREANKIQAFDFSSSPPVSTRIKEINALATSCEVMKFTIRERTENLARARDRLGMLVEAGLALSEEKDMAKLATLIFEFARDLTQADGGVTYLKEGDELEVELLSLGFESLVLGGLSENPAPRVKIRPAIMAFLSPDSVLRSACEAFNTRKTVVVRDRELSLFPTGLPEEPTSYPIRSLIAVPIVSRRDEVLGVIQIFNPNLEDETMFDAWERRDASDFVGSLAAQAAAALDNRNLVNSLRELFEALIQVIASSIDAKSPYTAGHCSRVPILAQMLAEAVHENGTCSCEGFRLDDEDERRQLRIAAWLHDCGKVTTPEFVVDKATKLETISDRIHEVRMRFEVLRRDAELEYLRKTLEGVHDPESLAKNRDEAFARLEEDFEFIATCNVGDSFMGDAEKNRLREIAERVWTRHFSDRIGISGDELRRKETIQDPGLPTPEPLLSDKPEHLIPRNKAYANLRDANGEPLMVPEHEYNRGEIHNLSVARGTLTPEERFKINEHTLSGLEMLNKIPFPDALRRVPEIASGHHETLTGTGYPLKKCKDNLCVEARILAVADVFEALTASDRPYKKAKTLSEALKIMSFMRNDQHIDSDIFDIFLREKIFLRYARNHLLPSQLDLEDGSGFMRQTQ